MKIRTLENVTEELRRAIKTQNHDLLIFGRHSIEFATSRIIVNTELETLKRCNFINEYLFTIDSDGIILMVTLKIGVDNNRYLYIG